MIRRDIRDDAERQVTSEPGVGFNWDRGAAVTAVDCPCDIGEDLLGIQHRATIDVEEDQIKTNSASVRGTNDEQEDSSRSYFTGDTRKEGAGTNQRRNHLGPVVKPRRVARVELVGRLSDSEGNHFVTVPVCDRDFQTAELE